MFMSSRSTWPSGASRSAARIGAGGSVQPDGVLRQTDPAIDCAIALHRGDDPPPFWWTPMLAFMSFTGVFDGRTASGVSRGVQAGGG